MYKSILVPLDGSEASEDGLQQAIGIAHGDIRAGAIVRGEAGSAELCGFDAATVAADATSIWRCTGVPRSVLAFRQYPNELTKRCFAGSR